MLFEPKLNLAEIPRVMRAVSKIAPHGIWKRRIEALRVEEQRNPLLTDYFNYEFRIERSYGGVHKYHENTGRYPAIDDQNYVLFSFLATLVLTYEGLTDAGRSRLSNNLRGGLKTGLGPLAAELTTAGQLMTQGFDVQFTDLEGSARFDFLASKAGMDIEVDCKSSSGDVGRQLHGRRFRSFANELLPILQQFVDSGGGRLIRVVLPSNLHGDVEAERRLAVQVRDALSDGREGTSPAGFRVFVTRFELTDSPFGSNRRISRDALADFLSQKFGLENVNAASRWSPGGGAAILVIQSEKPDHVVEGIYRQLRDSANTQFSTLRPAVLCVQLRDMTAAQLRNLANEQTNGLATIAARLFSADARSHLAGVSFVATSGALTMSRSISDGMLHTSHRDIGAAYTFSNRKNPSAEIMTAMFGDSRE